MLKCFELSHLTCSVLRRGTTPLVVAGEFLVFAKTPTRRNLVEIASKRD